MVFKRIIRLIGKSLLDIYNWSNSRDESPPIVIKELNIEEITEISQPKIKEINEIEKDADNKSSEIINLWDYFQFNENTQAFHLVKVVGFDEWVDMEEIRRRIRELYGIDYINERSLYPYIKTLVDSGLFEGISAGGRRKWRKKGLFFEKKKEKKKVEISIA